MSAWRYRQVVLLRSDLVLLLFLAEGCGTPTASAGQSQYASAYLEQLQRDARDRLPSGALPRSMRVSLECTTVDAERRNREIIEEMQQKYNLSPETVERLSRTAQARREALGTIKLPTHFEACDLYEVLSYYTRQVRETARAIMKSTNASAPEWPLFGTLNSGRVNAQKIPVPNTEPEESIVVFDSGLFAFLNKMSRLMVKAAPVMSGNSFSVEQQAVRESVASDDDLQINFVQLLRGYLFAGTVDNVPSNTFLFDTYGQDAISTALYRVNLEFAVAHEYGHLLEESTEFMSSITVAEAFTLDPSFRRLHPESRADVLAAIIVAEAEESKGWNAAALLANIEFYFHCYELLEKARSVVLLGNETATFDPTYPSAAQRRSTLRHYMHRRWTEGKGVPEANWREATRASDEFGGVMTVLWNTAQPILYNAHQNGRRLSGIWIH
jgi:hypothetical protein